MKTIFFTSSSDWLPFTMSQPLPRISNYVSVRKFLAVGTGVILLLFLLSKIFKENNSYDRLRDGELVEHVMVSHEAAALPNKGEILCWMLTSEKYHDTRVEAANETWLNRCDHGVVFTNSPIKPEKRIPYRTVFAGIPDVYENLFYKSRYAFYYISEIMKADFDWFLKADDDTYIIMDNLRSYLRTLDPTQPYYLGYRMKPQLEMGYNSGGGGYVLSRKALELFIQDSYNNTEKCPDDINEDMGIGRCLANIGIFPHPTINEQGLQRFNAYHHRQTIEGWTPELDGKYEEWVYDPLIKGSAGVPRDLISFHHLTPTEMRLFDILLYRVDASGGQK